MQTNFPLKDYNTFHFDVKAAWYDTIENPATLKEQILQGDLKTERILILGEGSNVLFRENFSGLILHPVEKSIDIQEENQEDALIKVSAGYNWDEFVEWTVRHGYYGLENLSLIPGQVGAAPIQNIGAYGVEVKDLIESVEGFYLDTGKDFMLPAEACQFDYRDSVFKKELRGKVFISYVYFRLSKKASPEIRYGKITEELAGRAPTPELVRDIVMEIRNQKLPDPTKTGNAGSFFKNPVVSKAQFELIRHDYPDVKYYPVDDLVKIPAGWLIEKAGWKAYRVGDAGVHPKQALVLVNYGMAGPDEILKLAEQIREDIQYKFGIELEMEVRII
jgi:UDP-N-acetylmuramate dehydrogenase